MTPELLATAFDLFKQAQQGLDRTQGGLGVGLTLVQRLVELHDGTVEAGSQGAGRGSEVEVRLPLPHAPANVRPSTNGHAAELGGGNTRRILLVANKPEAAQALRP